MVNPEGEAVTPEDPEECGEGVGMGKSLLLGHVTTWGLLALGAGLWLHHMTICTCTWLVLLTLAFLKAVLT